MNRRNFFKLLAGAAAVAALAPKLLIAPKQTWVDIKFTTRDMMLSLNDFQARVPDPAMQALAKRLDDELINDLKFMAGDRWPKEYTIQRGNVPLEFNVIQRSEPMDFHWDGEHGSDKFG